MTPPANRDQRMPLLVGLLQSATIRDSAIPLGDLNGDDDGADVDLEELASKRTAGGNLLDSVANMANSILGAGE